MSPRGSGSALAASSRRGSSVARIFRLGEEGAAEALAGASCAFGVFDGVHEGHRYLIGSAVDAAREAGTPSAVITFDVDPDELFRPRSLRKLMSNDERLAALAASGADAVVALPFTPAFAAQEPRAFLDAALGPCVPSQLHVGADFRFGARGSGTVADLTAWGAERGMAVVPHELLAEDGSPVTATRIRSLLAQGDVAEAARLLGRPYRLGGTVEPGRGEGRDFGIRTANLRVPDELRAVGDGVYACYAHVGGRRYKAAVNVGVAATFADEATATVEAHLLDFDQDVYGQPMELEFVTWLRPMRVFANTDELIATITANIDWVRANL
ncbi:MAG: riboflavin biosynthesis protein RibF [Eggerthellaceae bacterium]|nr:riboflavin biosynthesis protein RibF [Eggerthellaceae bacterium]